MSRKKGPPAYPKKSKIRTVYVTAAVDAGIEALARRLGRSYSDLNEQGLRHVLLTLGPETPLLNKPGWTKNSKSETFGVGSDVATPDQPEPQAVGER